MCRLRTGTDESTNVIFSGALHAGDIYRVSGISFAGSSLLSSEAFAAAAKLHTGDIASRARLLETLQPLDMAYRREGYADVIVDAIPTKNTATHEVAYTVTVIPGKQYHVKTVTPNGLDAADKAVFDGAFAVKPGDIYNPEYLHSFLKGNGTWHGLSGYSFAYKAFADPNTHTVDLELYFARGGIQQNVTVYGGQ